MSQHENNDTIKTYSDFFSFSFQDLLRLTKKDEELFISLYYNRTPEYDQIKSMLKNIKNRGDNILITGDAGMGKSNFMYRIFFDKTIINEYNLYPIIVDYRDTNNKDYCLINFITSALDYFEMIGHPLHTLKDNVQENIFININLIQAHLARLNEKELVKYLIIFIDDLDYAVNDLFELLEHFLPFASSTKSSIILSARPSLHSAISSFDSRFAVYFTRDVQRVKLKSLATSKLLAKRLAPVLKEEMTQPLVNLINKLIGKDASYTKLLKAYGIDDLEKLEKISLPFTHLYNNFMTSVTNGNIREIFDIAYESLIYILNNPGLRDVKEPHEGEELIKKELTNEHVMQLFYDKVFDEKDGYKKSYTLLNIHEYRSKSGNSLIYNLLEAVKKYEYLNDEFYESLALLGHKRENVIKMVSILENKTYRMIVPTKDLPQKMIDQALLFRHYHTTPKGDYYLTNIAFWDEYISRCGEIGKSLRTH